MLKVVVARVYVVPLTLFVKVGKVIRTVFSEEVELTVPVILQGITTTCGDAEVAGRGDVCLIVKLKSIPFAKNWDISLAAKELAVAIWKLPKGALPLTVMVAGLVEGGE